MKPTYIVLILMSFSGFLQAQDSALVSFPQAPTLAETLKGPLLSSNPAAQELADLFLAAGAGELEPSEAVTRAAEKADNAIAGLTELLSSETIRGSKKQTDPEGNIIAPNKIYAVLALEAIGTPQAFGVLLQTANSHNNAEARGLALNSFITAYYEKVRKENLMPQGEIIDTLLRNTDDETYIGYLQKTIGQIAEDGMSRWLGIDFSEPQFSDARLEMLPKEYRRKWWQENVDKVQWNNETGRFEVK